MNVDVLVAGGGPVGLAAAIEARLAGLEVAVLEPREGVIDKACGEGLMPGALPVLERLGVQPHGMPLRGVLYSDGSRTASHRFAYGAGRGVRRTILHEALVERADAVGVRRLQHRVRSVEASADGVVVDGMRAGWLLGCDGLHSSVRRLAGLERTARGRRRYGIRRHYRIEPWSDLIEVHWSPRVEAYVTPVDDGLVGVTLLGPQRTDFDEALAEIPVLSAALAGAASEGSRGAGPLRQVATAPARGRVLLVGDASGYVDAITGEGLRVGFAQARAAVAAIRAGGARSYEREWRKVTRDFRVLTSGLVAAAVSPLRSRIVPTAVRFPALYGAAVERLAR